jgi:DNA-binding winged helix-turn-helix (wHTH) protein/TolB-like protein/Tfp pilus assembly protein PilF
MSAQNGHFFEFGPFRLDAEERVLWRDGQPVPLTAKAFETLLVLVEHRGHIVGKEELLREVWPDSFVEEGNLSFNVSLLRKALGEDAHRPQFIETVARRGYRFIADVRAVDGHEVSELMVETRTRSSVVVEEETDEESSTAGGGARVAEAVKIQPATAAAIAQPVGESKWLFKSKTALAQALLIPAAAVVVAIAVVTYFFYPTHSGEAIDSVAVMPFANVGNDENTKYLSDGISDSIINRLSQLPSLKRVISLTSVLRYKGQQVDPQTIGRELNVRAVLIGKLTLRGDDLLISAELVDVKDNKRLWGGQYNRKLADVVRLQGEIAQEIAGGLRLKLTGEQKERLAKHYTESTEAYRAYLKGRFFLEKRTGPTTKKSIEYLEEAIRLDPNYGLAYATLANGYLSNQEGGSLRNEAKQAVAKALEIDDTLAEAQAALGNIRLIEGDWSAAERAFIRARDLNPNYQRFHLDYAHYLRLMKRFEEAVAESKRVLDIDPLSVLYNRNVALALYFARQYDEAIKQCRKTLELEPGMPRAYRWLAKSYEQKGLYDQAVEAWLKTEQFTVHGPEAGAALRGAYAASGWKGFWRKAIDLKKARTKQMNVDLYSLAESYARLGDKDQAFAWLEKAYEQNDRSLLIWLNCDPFWDDLRADPRYADLVQRMGLEP